MIKKIILILIIVLTPGIILAKDNVYIDNINIHSYKGYIGKWTLIRSKSTLNYYLKKFYISMNDIKNINGYSKNNNYYLFIPFSERYIKEQKNERECVSTHESNFIWPLNEIQRISSSFGMRLGRMHEGFDLPAIIGTPVFAAMDGRVITSGYSSGHGNSLYIEHRNDFYTRYSHNSVILVKKGDFVKKGQIIAFVGSTGNSTGSHLHFEIRYNNIPLNPYDFLPAKDHLEKTD